MKLDILVTSSLLILALLLLRQVFRTTISRRVQYALWGLVLVRLLVPVSLPAMEHNVLTATEPVRQSVTEQAEGRTVYVLPTGQVDLPEESRRNPELQPGYAMAPTSTGIMVVDEGGETATVYAGWMTGAQLLRCIWYAGMAVTGCWFILSNLLFWRKLRKARVPYSVDNCFLPVYLVETGLPSPCLFGLLRPAIYLTPAAVATPEALRHVIAHETTHARHLDPLWSLLRGVCLTAYWFDPLVWLAAAVSRRDCELACDEGALRRLGDEERIPYGRTLLSLIPVGTVNPLLAATTMSAGKRQLKDRVQRIARQPRTMAVALFAVIALTALVCAVTFTGTAEKPKDWEPLSEEELAWFNESWINDGNYHLRGQFLTSLYDDPADIDLYELFYNGSSLPGSLSQEERQAVIDAGYGGFDPEIDLIKIPAADVNTVLVEYTGLTLEETHKVNLDRFTYLPDYDAYYHFHGDTNARASLTFTAGSRQGDLIRLIYNDAFLYGGYMAVTLRDMGDGVYHFVSNRRYIPSAGEPEQVISLQNAAPYAVETVSTQARTGDIQEIITSCFLSDGDATDRSAVFYRALDGDIYGALVQGDPAQPLAVERFLTVDYGDTSRIAIRPFSDVLGRDGFVAEYPTDARSTVTAYYALDDDGRLCRLFETTGYCFTCDMDADGQAELLWDPWDAEEAARGLHLLFRREGGLYQAHLQALVEEAYPDWFLPNFGTFNEKTALLPISGYTEDGGLLCQRYLRFTGDTLEIYRDNRATVDHVVEGIDVPEAVLAAAKNVALGEFNRVLSAAEETDSFYAEAGYDDWRVESLCYAGGRSIAGIETEVYRLNYELHATNPKGVMLAGGMYVKEDGWVCTTYPDCTYLLFIRNGDTLLYGFQAMINDAGPDSDFFWEDMENLLVTVGIYADSDQLLHDAILECFEARQPVGTLYAAESHRVFDTVEEGDHIFTYYALALYQTYTFDRGLIPGKCTLAPFTVTFQQESGGFRLLSWEVPHDAEMLTDGDPVRSGDNLWEDLVRATYPETSVREILENRGAYLPQLRAECDAQAAAYWETGYTTCLKNIGTGALADYLLYLTREVASPRLRDDLMAEDVLSTLSDRLFQQPSDTLDAFAALEETEQTDLIHLLALEIWDDSRWEESTLSRWPDTFSPEATAFRDALAEAIQTLNGDSQRMVESSAHSLRLFYPSGWDDFALVETDTEDGAAFVLRERESYETQGNGLVWRITVWKRADFETAYGTDLGQSIGPAGGVIGTDDEHVYVLTEPTDVQYRPNDFLSRRHYITLRLGSQMVLEDFLTGNNIHYNDLCPSFNCFYGQ